MTKLPTLAIVGAIAALAACTPAPPAGEAAKPEAAAPAPAAPLVLSDGWAAITPNGAKIGGGYLTITNNTDAPDKLTAIVSARAPHVELHEMKMDGAMMTMSKVDALTIPAHGAVVLQPGGYHLMFIDIPAPFKAGETVPVTLTFEHAGARALALTVRERTEQDAHGGMDMKDGH